MTLDLKCEVCSKPAIGVCNALGPMSSAFCKECLQAGRVTYSNLVGYLYCASSEPPKDWKDKSVFAEWVHPTIDATLAFYKKSFEDFKSDCEEALKDYEEYLKSEKESKVDLANNLKEEIKTFLSKEDNK